VTLADVVRAAGARLATAGLEPGEAERDARLLARHAMGWDQATYVVRRQESPPSDFRAAYESLVARRARREPVAYIRGVQEFYGREFMVSPAVLIPRPESELVIDEARAWLASSVPSAAPVIVDVGTGSGCLAVTIAGETGADVVGTDTSAEAIRVARANAARHQVDRQLRFAIGEYLDPVRGPIHLIVANPPYVEEGQRGSLPPEVARYEPAEAIFGGPDGLRYIRGLLDRAALRLVAGGALIMEIGAGQADAVRAAVCGMPELALVRLREDLQGIPRTAVVHRR
jgi:release factor glutamine methyltransferase